MSSISMIIRGFTTFRTFVIENTWWQGVTVGIISEANTHTSYCRKVGATFVICTKSHILFVDPIPLILGPFSLAFHPKKVVFN